MASPDALKLLEENNELLRQMYACLARIEIILATPKAERKKRSARARLQAKLIAEGRAASHDCTRRIPELWAEICPDCPPPTILTPERKTRMLYFWETMKGEEGVRAVFEIVANDDWLSGRQVHNQGARRAFMARPRGPVTLFEVVEHFPEIVERSYK